MEQPRRQRALLAPEIGHPWYAARVSSQAPASPPADVEPEVDAFIDALWLEDGLSPNTLAAYRRDLTLYARWLRAEHCLTLAQTQE